MGKLYLVPTPLGKRKENLSLPEHTLSVVRGLNRFIVENIRSAQSFLQWIEHPLKPFEPDFRLLNRKTPDHEIYSFLSLIREGDTGLMSEAGAPAIADPGSKLVRMAHEAGHTVHPLSGPSSIVLALMASGLPGQQFTFHGYLPRDGHSRTRAITELESDSRKTERTQIFMEAPFRNQPLFEALVKTLQPETLLTVAVRLTMPDEEVITKPVSEWLADPKPDLNGRPAIFLLYCKNV